LIGQRRRRGALCAHRRVQRARRLARFSGWTRRTRSTSWAGNDGGLFFSFDGGNRWLKNNNLPVSQFYHVRWTTGSLRVYGGSRTTPAGWRRARTAGSLHQRLGELYGGDALDRARSHRSEGCTRSRREASSPAWTGASRRAGTSSRGRLQGRLRFNWNTRSSSARRTRARLHRGAVPFSVPRDRGDTWERISPDLTTNDPEKQKQEESGCVTVDNSSAEEHTTHLLDQRVALRPQHIWVGTDDGNLQLTRDGGKSWTNLVRKREGVASELLGELGGGEPSMTPHRVCGLRSAHVRRHDPWVYRPPTSADLDAHRGTRAGRPRVRPRHSRRPDPQRPPVPRHRARPLDLGGRRKDLGRVQGQQLPRGRPCGTSRSSRATGTWCWVPMGAASGSSTTSRPCVPSLRKCWRRRPRLALAHDAAAHPRLGRLAGGRRDLHWPQSASGAVLSYYQRTRHLFGPIKLELLDAQGHLVDTVPAVEAARDQPGCLDHAGEAAAGAARRDAGVRGIAGPPGGAPGPTRCGSPRARRCTRRSSRSAWTAARPGRRPIVASTSMRDEGARALRRDERPGGEDRLRQRRPGDNG